MCSSRRCCGLLTALFAVASVAWSAEVVPVVPNPGLEEGGADGPAGWAWSTGEEGRGEFGWATVPAHGGQRAFRVAFRGAVGHTALVSGFVPVESGQTYVVTGWVCPARQVRRGVYFMISQYRADSDEAQYPNAFGRVDQPLDAGRWQPLRVEVTVRPGNSRVRVHGIQAFAPSDISWDDLAVTPAAAATAAAPAPRYEPPTAEPLPDLEPARVVLARRPRAEVRVETLNGRPWLRLDGQPTPWAFYVSPFWNPKDAQVRDFRAAGVRVYLVPLVLGRGVYGDRGPWLGPGQWDFAEVDDLLWRVLCVDPEGYILFYMACDPYAAWGADNPDHVTRDQNGQRAIVDMHPKRWGDDPKPPERFGPSPASPKLRTDVAETLRRLVAHVEASEPGKAVIGYLVAGLNDGQWFQWAGLAGNDLHLADYSPGAVAAYREWLARRYAGDQNALRQAWASPTATFAAAAPPAFDRSWTADGLLDLRTQQDIADWTRFYSEGVAETVLGLARTLKQATARRILCGTYYEDITCNSPNHVALGLFLRDDALDFLAGPAAYGIRLPGYQGAVRSVFASTLLHGKTYLTEQDWRSFHSSPDSAENNAAWGRAETAAEHNAMVRRECGMMLAFGLGTWWYDMSGGWFRDDGIMAGIAEALRAFRLDLESRAAPTADLAVVVSEDSNHAVAPRAGGSYRYVGVLEAIQELNTAGVPYRLYLQSDLARPDLPAHKAYVFLNPYAISAAERQAIEGLKRDGRVLVFLHAPGVAGAADPAAAVSEVTGLRVQPATVTGRPGTVPLESDHPLLRDLDGAMNLAGSLVGPTFEVVDPQATPLARYAGGGTAVAAALRDFSTWRSVFVGRPGLSAPFVHNLARWSGCWCPSEPGDAVYANSRFLTIHALFTGHKQLTLPRTCRVVDLSSGQTVAAATDRLEIDMERGTTRWFQLEDPGEAGAAAGAADQPAILVEARFVELPAGQDLTAAEKADPELGAKLATRPGVDVLSAPRVVTAAGAEATVRVGADGEDGEGVSLTIRPEFAGPRIRFTATGRVARRVPVAGGAAPALRVVQFQTEAEVDDGQSLVVGGLRQEVAAGQPPGRTLVVILTCRRADPPEPAH